jgi:predicted transposase/invertase (TIGR01784 family)
MRRDTIFYRLFAQYPQLLFQLLDQPPNNPETYRFDSVSIKEPTFTIDGVFLPPDSQPPSTVFFAEVQFQKDKYLYERLFSESFLYFYRNRDRFSDWQAILIYPNRSTEQPETQPYSDLLNGPRVHRIYLNELGDLQTLPPEIALMVLTTLEAPALSDQAQALVTRTQQSQIPEPRQRDIIEMVTTILVYQFTHLSRQEVRAMLGRVIN